LKKLKTNEMKNNNENTELDKDWQKRLARRLFLWAARCHPKNQNAANIDYPQLWYCWPLWTKRIKWAHRIKTWMCGKTTNHEWSKTEIGYSGCGVNRWCRWCDKMVTMPFCESPLNGQLKDLAKQIKKP
jgi:hypothetical protein